MTQKIKINEPTSGPVKVAPPIQAKLGMPIILLHRGNPGYLKYTLRKARETNPKSKIILIGDKSNSYYDFVERYPIYYGKDALEFIRIYKHQSKLQHDFELFCFLRWFVLRDFVSTHKIKKCLHIDSDVLLYCDVNEESRAFEQYDMTLCRWSKYGCSAHTAFINNVDILSELCDFIIETYQIEDNFKRLLWSCDEIQGQPWIADMSLLHAFWQGHSDRIAFVEPIINNTCFDNYLTASTGSLRFKMVGGPKEPYKDIRFFGGIPFAEHEEYPGLVRLKTIHFHGYTKYLMKYYYFGSNFHLFVSAESFCRKIVRFTKMTLKSLGVKWLLQKANIIQPQS